MPFSTARLPAAWCPQGRDSGAIGDPVRSGTDVSHLETLPIVFLSPFCLASPFQLLRPLIGGRSPRAGSLGALGTAGLCPRQALGGADTSQGHRPLDVRLFHGPQTEQEGQGGPPRGQEQGSGRRRQGLAVSETPWKQKRKRTEQSKT